MSFSPENKNPSNQQEDEFDFTKSLDTYDPSVKIAEIQAKIDSTIRAIGLATKLNDPVRTAEMQQKKIAFEAAIKILQAELPEQETAPEEPAHESSNVADMSDRTTRRLDARGNT